MSSVAPPATPTDAARRDAFVARLSSAMLGMADVLTTYLGDRLAALRTMRRLLAPGGVVLVVDERVGERFTAPGDDLERLMYAFSVLCCLPAGLAETPSAATGTVIRPATLRRYAQAAGFGGVDVLPIEHDFFRLYLLSA